MMNDFITPVKFKINLIAKQKNSVKSFLRKKERRNSFTIKANTYATKFKQHTQILIIIVIQTIMKILKRPLLSLLT